MRYYTAIVHQEGNSAFGLTFPDLPGCHAAADSWDEIPAAATDALDLWFEDQPDIVPMSLDALRKRADVAGELAAGAVPMLVPYIPADTAVERINITMERGLLRAIDATAKARGMTRSSFLASAARREMVGVAPRAESPVKFYRIQLTQNTEFPVGGPHYQLRIFREDGSEVPPSGINYSSESAALAAIPAKFRKTTRLTGLLG